MRGPSLVLAPAFLFFQLQVSEFCRQTPVGGLFHVHHLRVSAQNVELPKPFYCISLIHIFVK